MSVVVTRPLSWRNFALCVLLCYPIMGSKWFPFGGGPRYLSVLVAPLCLLLLWQQHRISTISPLLREALKWSMPFIPFVLGWVFAQWWHRYDPFDMTPLVTSIWCGLLFMGARLMVVTHRQLSIVASLAAVAYGVIALGEVFLEGRSRAWGGVYENRFGQYAIWLFALCILHFFLNDTWSKVSRNLLLLASLLGLTAAWLSGSRGALSAVPVLLALLLLASMKWRRGLIAVFLLAVCITILAYLSTPLSERFIVMYQEAFQFFSEPVFTPTSVGIRLELARVALFTWLQYPILGVGYVSIGQLYENHPFLGVPDPGLLVIPGFHSDWFQAIGIGGGVLLLSLLTTSFWLLARAIRDSYLLMFLGFSMVFSFSELFMTHNLGLGLLMSCWALYSAAECNRPHSHEID